MENVEQRLQDIEQRLAVQEHMHDHVSYTSNGGLHGKSNVVYRAIGTWLLAGFIIGVGVMIVVKMAAKKKQ